MQSYDSFIFKNVDFDPEKNLISLDYSLDDDIHFTETLTLDAKNGNEFSIFNSQFSILENALSALHLAGGVSYYKTCCPQNIEVRSTDLDENQVQFWNTVYTKGLGQFFYENNIDFRNLIKFPANCQAPVHRSDNVGGPTANCPQAERKTYPAQRILVPIGGGKDSIVTLELLRKTGADITLFRMGSHPLIDHMVEISGLPVITVTRQLSPNLFDLNTEGALNGHIPISAYVSALTVVLAQIYGFDAIAFSNERSASEGNVEFHGEEINHQWSKSLEFEMMFREYIQKYISPDIEYFSMLRSLSELHICQTLMKYPEYLTAVTSCNANWKILGEQIDKRWCCKCPKCAFVFALLGAFLPNDQITEMFGANLYEDTSLEPLYKQLLGIDGFKPFECVGTAEETQAAFYLAHKRGDMEDTAMMQLFVQDVLPDMQDPDAAVEQLLTPSDEHCIPKNIQSFLPQ